VLSALQPGVATSENFSFHRLACFVEHRTGGVYQSGLPSDPNECRDLNITRFIRRGGFFSDLRACCVR
jgi:hypothetical protein